MARVAVCKRHVPDIDKSQNGSHEMIGVNDLGELPVYREHDFCGGFVSVHIVGKGEFHHAGNERCGQAVTAGW